MYLIPYANDDFPSMTDLADRCAAERRETTMPPPFRLVTARSRPRPGIDLDQPRVLEARDDEARFGRGTRSVL